MAQASIPRSPPQPIERPIFIVGQPRTGTTILFDLLAQDPALRPPLTWEVDNPYPLPRPETYDTDPRIAETQASIEMSEQSSPACWRSIRWAHCSARSVCGSRRASSAA